MLTLANVPAPDGWLQFGALGIVAFIVFAAALMLLKFAPQLVEAVRGLGTQIAEQMEEQDRRHREERQALVAVITSEMGKVRDELRALREDIHTAVKQ